MTPHDFIKKWKPVALTERATGQSHFLDLCTLLGHDDPVKADPLGEWFTFEKGVTKTGGGDGFADVWKKGFFAWEYKKKKRNLDDALAQLVRYAAALENPPLQVACDTDRFLIRTAWTNAVSKTYELTLEELSEPQKLDILHAVFFDPEKLRPKETRAAVTKEAADKFSTIAFRLQGRGAPADVAHFVNQLVFCFFAHSVKLLPNGFFPKLLKRAAEKPENAKRYFDGLFEAMERGGEFDLTEIAHFNGGLFDGRRALPLRSDEIGLLQAAASLDWSQIDPTIFGTLFERFLDPEKRGQIGAHYTDPDKIMLIVEPVILRPLREEWARAKAEIEKLVDEAQLKRGKAFQNAMGKAEEARSRFLERLRKVTILDPACGSGNFLYLALQGVKDIELKANLECEALGLEPRVPLVDPEIVHGIEINPMAAELARTTIWIGDIQWRIRNGIHARPKPILRKLDSIECRDALITKVLASAPPAPSPAGSTRGSISSKKKMDGRVKPGHDDEEAKYVEAVWPASDFVIGNPPFLGGKLLRAGLGDELVDALFAVYRERVPPESDLVTYWFEKSRAQVKLGRARRVGLVATNSIRGGANRRVLDQIQQDAPIFEAWSDEPWVVDGAAVRVSLVCFGEEADLKHLDGRPVLTINSDLTAGAIDLTKARRLIENGDLCFQGVKFGGPFEITGGIARELLSLPMNPNGYSNAAVIRRWCNGMDVTRRKEDRWCIDFEPSMSERAAALFEQPFRLLKQAFADENERRQRGGKRPLRVRESRTANEWWIHQRPRIEMRHRIRELTRFIVTPEVSKYRLFAFFEPIYLTSGSVYTIARDDYVTFGILQSRFHDAWSLRLGTSLEDRPRYTPTTTFETFPFPKGLTPNIPAKDYADDPRAQAIARAAKRLDDLRNNWLNPPDLVRIEPEVVPGYPDRILPKDTVAAAGLRERTLTNLYNQRPQWLLDADRDLDAAVAAAYGWPADISEEDALAKLLELNLSRASAEKSSPAPEEDEAAADEH
jgi:type II restriction/modification system DNA methylase subunit YeeA